MKKNIDMINGSLPVNMLRFIVPLILTSVLQLLFNACDLIVVGQFAGNIALAAVGATGALINLLVNSFLGLSIGTNVLAAQAFGARDFDRASKIVHTSVAISLLLGVVLAFVGFFISRPCLLAMNTPDDVIDAAVLYMQIYFMGMPAMILYNFLAAILRAQGNTRHPLIFLTIAGIVNVILNLIFVIVFHMSVDGVALATAISQFVAAALIVISVMDSSSPCGLRIKKIRLHAALLKEIFRIGIPASINSMLFSFSNMQIQASINLFGSAAMAGCSAAANIEGFIYAPMNSLQHATMNFTGQNIGAGKKERIPSIIKWGLIYVTAIGLILGILSLVFRQQLLSIYVTDSAAINAGIVRMSIISSTYFLCGCMEVFTGILRGRGYSITPMIISLLGACGFRLLWIATVFQMFFSLKALYLSYPISWLLTGAALLICYIIVHKRENKRDLLMQKE